MERSSQWILWFLVFSTVLCDPYFTDLLYQDISHHFCSRYYHRKGGIGCHTTIDGDLGPLHLYSRNETGSLIQLKQFESCVVLVNTEDFPDIIMDLLAEASVRGIIVFGSKQSSIPFSPISKTPGGFNTPSEEIALHKDVEWNPVGLNFFYQDSSKPIAYVSDEEMISILLSKAKRNEELHFKHPFIADMNTYMGPTNMNSVACLEKQACEPIGGQSVWAGDVSSSKPLTFIVTALDSISDFYGSPNSMDTGITLSIVLTLAKALSEPIRNNSNHSIVFGFFQGESWGRVGSRKFLRDIQQFQCSRIVNASSSVFNDKMCYSPLKLSLKFENIQLDSIERVIVLDQLMSSSHELYAHSENGITHQFIKEGRNLIPPGIGESFVQAGINNVDVISGFDQEYEPYFGSSFNSVDESVIPIASNLTKLLAEEMVWSLDLEGPVSVDETYLEQLLLCFAVNGTCTLLEKELGLKDHILSHKLNGKPMNLYAGTFSDGRQPYLITSKGGRSVDYKEESLKDLGLYFNPSILENFVHTELSIFFHDEIPANNCTTWKDCKEYSNGYCIKGMCVQSKAYFHDALDTGLIAIAPNSFQLNTEVNNTPIYTEPYWGGYYGSEPAIQIYQKTSMVVEVVLFFTGILVTGIAWWLTSLFFAHYGSQLKLDK